MELLGLLFWVTVLQLVFGTGAALITLAWKRVKPSKKGRLALALVLLGLVLAGAGVWFNHFLLDGLPGLVYGLTLREDTYYSEHYSESAFRRVRLGMTVEEVNSLLGAPIKTHTIEAGAKEAWIYSSRRTDTHYRQRVLVFKGGKVVKIEADFYVD